MILIGIVGLVLGNRPIAVGALGVYLAVGIEVSGLRPVSP